MDAPKLFGRILVGIDKEGTATSAVVRAALLERRLGSKLNLVHAVEVPPALWPGIDAKKLASMHAGALVRERKETSERLRGTDIEARLDELLGVFPGHPAEIVLREAEAHLTDLILLGPHSTRSVFEFGSATRGILSRLPCPLWVQGEPVSPIQRILVPIDFSEHSRIALDCARGLAARLDASLVVQHCFLPSNTTGHMAEAVSNPSYILEEERKSSKRELKRWMDDTDWESVPVVSRYVEGDTVRQILRAARRADLIVVGTHGRTGLSRFLMGSTARGVLARSEKPVLVVPSPKRGWLL